MRKIAQWVVASAIAVSSFVALGAAVDHFSCDFSAVANMQRQVAPAPCDAGLEGQLVSMNP
jgi:hypothetical protein